MFKISDYLKEENIIMELSSTNKKDAIKELASLLKNAPQIEDFNKFLEDVFQREELGTTGIGQGVALPHARSEVVKNFVICFGRSKKGIDFEALDEEPVHLIFLIGNPKEDVENYLKTLAHLSRLLKKEKFRTSLMEAKNPQEIIEIFRLQEQ